MSEISGTINRVLQQAGRQADEIQVNFKKIKIHSIEKFNFSLKVQHH